MAYRSILVTGDFVVDQHIYAGRRSHYGQSARLGVKVHPELGGAALVHRLLGELLGEKSEWASHLAVEDAIPTGKAFSSSSSEHAYAFWRHFPKKPGSKEEVWRVHEAMGFGYHDGVGGCESWRPAPALPDRPEIVVLSEGGMGFRACDDNWHKEKLGAARWIVLKTTEPVGSGPLWEHLVATCREKLIVVVSAQELRKLPARLHAGLSWEDTVEGLLGELGSGGALHSLTQCRHLIVAFESEGALWLDLAGNAPADRACLVYEAGVIEGEQAKAIDGKAFGLLSCLAASVAWRLALGLDDPDLAAALEGGLAAMSDLRQEGHGSSTGVPEGFPASRLARAIQKTTFRYSRATFPPRLTAGTSEAGDAGATPPWSLLGQAIRSDGPAYALGRLVLLRGPIALQSLPHLSIGKLLAVERAEVEAYRTLTEVMRRYKEQDAGKKPLSIGVFGPPGAGKSFAVKELAEYLVGKDGWMEFNLSQFDPESPDELNGAFHRVRDEVLQGHLPVAFFDEFDCREYHWLQYLLAPMQDGKFQEGQLTHTLGKCIFIFAGGTSRTFDEFGPPKPPKEKREEEPEPNRRFRLAKGPDFKSRLDAYLNVVGPNPRELPAQPESVDSRDLVFPIRRALMIRSELKCGPDEKLAMDEGLVHALLHVGRYEHGARSLGKILQPFVAANRSEKLQRSLLLPSSQLAMHTGDAARFASLCADAPGPFSPEAPLTTEQIDVIAPAIHETYRELGRKEGWLKPEIDKAFEALYDFIKGSNRAAAARMLELLGLVGLRLVDGSASPAEEDEVRRHLEYHLLALAEAEHEGWMEWHLAQGWRYDPKRNDEKKLHDCLLLFSQLSDKEKNKDRDTIRHYLDFARVAGMKIVFVGSPKR